MRIILILLPLLSFVNGKGGVGGGRGASGARGASAAGGARGASSASRGASASASRPSGSYSAPRSVYTPVRSPSRSSFSGSSALLANRINNAYAPVSYGGNNYYWSRDVVPQDAPNVCSRPLTDIDAPALEDVMFQDGTRPSEFAWMCSSSEMCCDWSCCEDNGRSSIAVARRSFSDPTESTDDSTLTSPSSLESDSNTDTNTYDVTIPNEEGIEDESIYSEEYSYRGSIAGWIILGIAIAALILIIGCIGVFTVKRRRKAAQLNRQRRVVQQSQLPRDDPWTPDLPGSHHTPPVFTSPSMQGVPPSYSNIVHAAPMPKSTLPEKPPAYSTQ